MPQSPALSEADRADAERFLADLLLCLPVVGLTVFEKAEAGSSVERDLLLTAKGIEARGVDGADGFVVRERLRAVQAEVASIHGYLSELRSSLIAQGVMLESGDGYVFTQDYAFSSPSMAAGVLLGRASNGRTAWKDAQGHTLKEIQAAAAG